MAGITASLSIGQIAERTGLSVHALRFYEREGLFVNAVRRGPGGRRVYSEDDVNWLTVCIILRASGMPLPTLRRYADLVREGAGNEEERLTLMREHQENVISQIGRLNESLDLIRFKVGVYEDLVDQGSAARPCHAPSPSPDGERTPLLTRSAGAEAT
ncbi:MerR family transcriptional regulator [Streptomyces sparsogenes]|uniref:MerR family transcriptional regulator n=1 Tax=Streptomyces sparsogenes TaxID=67365 RepID=UPI0033C9D6DA